MKVKIEITLTNAENFPYIFKQLKIFGKVNVSIQGEWIENSKHRDFVYLRWWHKVESMGRNSFFLNLEGEEGTVEIPFRYDNLDKRCEIKLTVNEESGVN